MINTVARRPMSIWLCFYFSELGLYLCYPDQWVGTPPSNTVFLTGSYGYSSMWVTVALFPFDSKFLDFKARVNRLIELFNFCFEGERFTTLRFISHCFLYIPNLHIAVFH